MKTQIISEPIYKLEKIQTGEKEKTVYISVDGKQFNNENDCIKYEKKLDVIKNAEGLIEEIEIDVDKASNILTILFYAYNTSSANFFKYKASNDENTIMKIASYLAAKGCDIYSLSKLKGFTEGEELLIAHWVEDEDSDYPHNNYGVIKFSDAIEKINNHFAEIKLALFNEDIEIKNIAHYIAEKAESKGWENAECMASDKFGKEKAEKAMKFIDKYANLF